LNVSFGYGLAAVPSFLRAVLLCTTNDAVTGMVAGQEVGIEAVLNYSVPATIFGVVVDSANIYLTYDGSDSSDTTVAVFGVIRPPSSFSNFSLKVYWR
jgi:hypothetical protein